MAASESAESDPRLTDGATFIWHSVEVFVENPCSGWENARKVASCWKALPHGWHFRVEVFPNGLSPEEEGFLSSFIGVRPPAMLEGKDWIFPDLQHVRFIIKGETALQSFVLSTSLDSPLRKSRRDYGFRRLVPHGTILRRNWVSAGKLCIVGEAAFLPVNFPSPDLPPELFSKEPEFVMFLLADGSKLHFDKRLVVERSRHFANMLSSETWIEGRTNIIDLRGNEQADVASMQAVLCHFMSQRFRAACNDELALSVRKLADQFCLDALVQEVETELVPKVCKDNVLQFLGKVLGSGGILEARCLEMVKANACEILDKQGSQLEELVDDNPALAKFLMRVLLNAARGRRS
ncbi:hypothetical protein AK812_SmicGene30037 [Symbiodinium microadriaticum]|uniref:BTB domain-containing protein n=1 Tax=Symbiodinium microadriaticum TaxID=2951 RepID=A0A1Q9D0B3_SYMMI|nr:hypothetical protein AK812_SmicGene30037 [Symbiodinium microadriaticum]CAE7945248.1 unnamed protein product [Symbiodinium sp. KB8]